MIVDRVSTVHVWGDIARRTVERHLEVLDGRTIRVVADDEWDALAGEIEVLFALALPARDWSDAARLRLVQGLGVGTDRLLPLPGLPAEAVVANAGGVSAVAMAEYVVAALLHVAKQFPEAADNQADRRWTTTRPWVMSGRRIVILGVGPVGVETAARLAPFGVTCVGVTRRPRPVVGFDEVVDVDGLHDVLGTADAVVIALPLNGGTRGLVGAAEIAALPDHAIVVNVGRGAIIDSTALEQALRGGRLSGAVLDVFDSEPLPADDLLWECPRLTITPHVSWYDPDMLGRVAAILAENVGHVERGEPVRNEVDRDLGYPVR